MPVVALVKKGSTRSEDPVGDVALEADITVCPPGNVIQDFTLKPEIVAQDDVMSAPECPDPVPGKSEPPVLTVLGGRVVAGHRLLVAIDIRVSPSCTI